MTPYVFSSATPRSAHGRARSQRNGSPPSATTLSDGSGSGDDGDEDCDADDDAEPATEAISEKSDGVAQACVAPSAAIAPAMSCTRWPRGAQHSSAPAIAVERTSPMHGSHVCAEQSSTREPASMRWLASLARAYASSARRSHATPLGVPVLPDV